MKSFSGGYIGILLLFLGTTLVIVLAIQQYERIGQRTQNRAAEQEGVGMQNGEDNKILYPIDRALDAKEALEARDRMLMEQ